VSESQLRQTGPAPARLSRNTIGSALPAIELAPPARLDLDWLRKNVPILDIARELDLEVMGNRSRCWRTENHRNGDADPSLRFHVGKNRARCFVCDKIGGCSNIDLVMKVLNCGFREALAWISGRFVVPAAPPGKHVGTRQIWHSSYRAGTTGSSSEPLVRSGLD